MEINIGPCRLQLVRGDITEQDTDAVVNAANSRLAGGGGVDGAIHRKGGPSIMEETRRRYPDGCPTGEAVISGAGKLPARYVIHAVGPIWRGGQAGEEEKLARAYESSLRLAVEHNCGSVSFPSLSTGAYGYPVQRASRTALRTVVDFLKRTHQPSLVRFVLFDEPTWQAYQRALIELAQEEGFQGIS